MKTPANDVLRDVAPHNAGARGADRKTQWRAREHAPMMCGSGVIPMNPSH